MHDKEDEDKRINEDLDQSSSPISSLPTSPSAYGDDDGDGDDDDDDDVYSRDEPWQSVQHHNNNNLAPSSSPVAAAAVAASPRPQTPPPLTPRPHGTHGQEQQQQQQQQHHHARSPPSALSSPMSLHHLGISSSPLSPLRRQFSSPLFRSPPHPAIATYDADDESGEEEETRDQPDDSIDSSREDTQGRAQTAAPSSQPDDDELTQDSKDVLIERLTDLVQRLSAGHSTQESSLSALHAKVDEMEAVMATVPLQPIVNGKTPATTRGLRSASSLTSWLAPPLQLAASGSGSGTLLIKEPSLVAGVARLVVDEADRLSAQLASAVQGLQQRREESDHLHAMLVDRAEAAAARILELEKVVFDLEDEVSDNESELRHLRLELRAVEALCNTLLPSDVDPDLVESIQNWKSDWQRLRDKMSARKKDRHQLKRAAAVEGVEESSFVSITNLSILGASQSPSKLC
ncbi:hypothetical protein B0T22DRAFT_483488 [Podospora appendiculata]|uniref:Uncharacterized protein n=1 Tax=Podospora appendiculata TaxID=314037 RepID=A0AAE0X3B6_9PEZI|nr:hypothetical protein B0T22DRAFT_483488 [Podospora appendiculata]